MTLATSTVRNQLLPIISKFIKEGRINSIQQKHCPALKNLECTNQQAQLTIVVIFTFYSLSITISIAALLS